jgi:hypothetical protein
MPDHALTQQEVLNALRQAGVIEATSITALGEGWNWERSRTSKAINRWERTGRIQREPGPGRKIVIRMWEGAGNGSVNGNGVNGNGPGQRRKAGTSGNAHTGKRKAGPNGTVHGAGPVHGHKAEPNGAASTGTVNGNAYTGNGAAVHASAAVHGPAVHDPIPASSPVPAPAIIPAPKPDYTTLRIAFAIASVSAGFSIYGLTSIFIGALWPVIALGAVLEAGKLRAVTLIGMGRGVWWVRALLVAAVLALMGLNAVGAYGFLAKAHLAATEKAKAATEEVGKATEAANKAIAASLADIDGKIAVQNNTIANINRQLSEIHGGIEKGITQGKVNGAMALINQERNRLAQLQTDLQAAGRVLTDLKVQKAKIEPSPDKKDEKGKDDETKAKEEQVELGPVHHLAALLGADGETARRWFTLVIAFLLDPLAVLLLLAAATDD